METDTLIEELNLLWEPIRPYLAMQIEELYGRREGTFWKWAPFRAWYLLSLKKMLARAS